MQNRITALLVGLDENLLHALKQTLEQLGIETEIAQSIEQARTLLEQPNPPELVFSEVSLSDGTWSAVLNLAAKATVPVQVIVVSQVVDYKLFIDVLERVALILLCLLFSQLILDMWFAASKKERPISAVNHREA